VPIHGIVKILVAEDDPTSRRLLEVSLSRTGYDVVATADGEEAWLALQQPQPPRLAILDWMMPGRDGIEICRAIRQREGMGYIYVMLVTTKTRTEDIVAGLQAGADDYLTKPYDPHELRSRVATGRRVIELESALAKKVEELSDALSHVKQLQGLLPICMYCKKIRDDSDTWHRLETYIEHHSDAMFSHSLCQDCRQEHFPALASTGRGTEGA
jgi:CheY-like chemotaxis protein